MGRAREVTLGHCSLGRSLLSLSCSGGKSWAGKVPGTLAAWSLPSPPGSALPSTRLSGKIFRRQKPDLSAHLSSPDNSRSPPSQSGSSMGGQIGRTQVWEVLSWKPADLASPKWKSKEETTNRSEGCAGRTCHEETQLLQTLCPGSTGSLGQATGCWRNAGAWEADPCPPRLLQVLPLVPSGAGQV